MSHIVCSARRGYPGETWQIKVGKGGSLRSAEKRDSPLQVSDVNASPPAGLGDSLVLSSRLRKYPGIYLPREGGPVGVTLRRPGGPGQGPSDIRNVTAIDPERDKLTLAEGEIQPFCLV